MALQEFIANAKLRDFARSSKYLVIVDLPRGPSANQNGGANQLASLLRTFGVSSADSFAQSFNRANGQYLSSLFAEVTALFSVIPFRRSLLLVLSKVITSLLRLPPPDNVRVFAPRASPPA